MTTPTRRSMLSMLAVGVVTGCAQRNPNPNLPVQNTSKNSTNPNPNLSDQNTSKSKTNPNPQTPTITDITETSPPEDTPRVDDKVLFRELPNKDAILISKTVLETKCKIRSVGHTNPTSNNFNIQFSYEDKERADENCDPSLDRIEFAVQVSFDTLQSGISLSVDTFYWTKSVSYTTTATQTQSVKTIPKTMATHDDGAIRND